MLPEVGTSGGNVYSTMKGGECVADSGADPVCSWRQMGKGKAVSRDCLVQQLQQRFTSTHGSAVAERVWEESFEACPDVSAV